MPIGGYQYATGRGLETASGDLLWNQHLLSTTKSRDAKVTVVLTTGNTIGYDAGGPKQKQALFRRRCCPYPNYVVVIVLCLENYSVC
jgi:hypothetical protein